MKELDLAESDINLYNSLDNEAKEIGLQNCTGAFIAIFYAFNFLEDDVVEKMIERGQFQRMQRKEEPVTGYMDTSMSSDDPMSLLDII